MNKILEELAHIGYEDYLKQDRVHVSFKKYFKILKAKFDSGDKNVTKLYEKYKNKSKVVKENAKTVLVECPDGNVIKKKKRKIEIIGGKK